jgi:hypothetical protein
MVKQDKYYLSRAIEMKINGNINKNPRNAMAAAAFACDMKLLVVFQLVVAPKTAELPDNNRIAETW